MWRLLALAMALAAASPVRAADLDRSRQVVRMVYDIGLYDAELDRVMAEADGRHLYAVATPAATARIRAATHALMLRQREAVLSVTTTTVAARATNEQLGELLHMAASSDTSTVNAQLIGQAVAVIKSSFEQALWDQLARTARGSAEFPCTREQRGRCL